MTKEEILKEIEPAVRHRKLMQYIREILDEGHFTMSQKREIYNRWGINAHMYHIPGIGLEIDGKKFDLDTFYDEFGPSKGTIPLDIEVCRDDTPTRDIKDEYKFNKVEMSDKPHTIHDNSADFVFIIFEVVDKTAKVIAVTRNMKECDDILKYYPTAQVLNINVNNEILPEKHHIYRIDFYRKTGKIINIRLLTEYHETLKAMERIYKKDQFDNSEKSEGFCFIEANSIEDAMTKYRDLIYKSLSERRI